MSFYEYYSFILLNLYLILHSFYLPRNKITNINYLPCLLIMIKTTKNIITIISCFKPTNNAAYMSLLQVLHMNLNTVCMFKILYS